jgi:hypothetical protein
MIYYILGYLAMSAATAIAVGNLSSHNKNEVIASIIVDLL